MRNLDSLRALVPDDLIVDGHRIAHGVHGAGEPVVLVHGTPSSSYIWRHVCPSLIEAGYRVHLFDLLGFGLSERPWHPGTDTSVSAQVPVLAALFEAWGLDGAHVVAHDIGGAVGLRFGVFHPELASTLTVLDACTFDSWPSRRTKEQMAVGLEPLIKKPDEAHREHFRDWLLSTVENRDRFAADGLEVFVDFISGAIGQASLFQHQVRHYDAKHTLEITDRLVELGERPMHIIWGEEDGWQHIAWAHKLQGAIPGSVLDVVPEAGHFVMEDRPDTVSELLIEFFRRCAVDNDGASNA